MDNNKTVEKTVVKKTLIKKCHVCGSISESSEEVMRCPSCKKAFLPTNYFGKVHTKNSQDYSELFIASDKLHEEDLIKGLSVLW